MGFGQGLSGLRAQAQKLDVIGNNIANAGTVGFKSSTVSFADVYATSRVGLGTQVAAVNQNFGIGSISSTGGQFDMAIDGASGLFRVMDTNGNVLYTRNGEFSANKEGFLVNAQGYRLTGFEGDSTAPTPIRVPTGNIAPQETSRITSVVNVDANVKPIAAGAGAGTPEVLGVLADNGTPSTSHYFRVDATGQYTWVDATGAAPAAAPTSPFTAAGGQVITFDGGGQPTDINGVAITDPVADLAGIVQAAYAPAVPPAGGTPEVLGVLADNGTPSTSHYFRVDATGQYTWVDATGAAPAAAPTSPFTAAGGQVITFDGGGQPTDINGVAITDPVADLAGIVQAAYAPAVPAPGGLAFDPLDPDTFHHMLPLTVYDALGNPHQVAQYFIKRPGTPAPYWEVQYVTTTRDTAGNQLTLTPSSAIVEFNSRGEFVATNPADLALALTLDNTIAPTEPLAIQINYAGSTQFAGAFSYTFDQDGYPTGEYSSMSIGPNGEIVAAYTNGETQLQGYLVLANFTNVQGLQPVGGNAWRESSESGQPVLGTPGTNGMALIKGQALEESNVDMGTELVNMIITQRTYQANAQTITTQSEVLQTLLNIR